MMLFIRIVAGCFSFFVSAAAMGQLPFFSIPQEIKDLKATISDEKEGAACINLQGKWEGKCYENGDERSDQIEIYQDRCDSIWFGSGEGYEMGASRDKINASNWGSSSERTVVEWSEDGQSLKMKLNITGRNHQGGVIWGHDGGGTMKFVGEDILQAEVGVQWHTEVNGERKVGGYSSTCTYKRIKPGAPSSSETIDIPIEPAVKAGAIETIEEEAEGAIEPAADPKL